MLTFQAKLLKTNGATVFINNEQYTFDSNHEHFVKLMKYVKENDVDEFLNTWNMQKIALAKISGNGISVQDKVIYYDGVEIHSSLTTRIFEMIQNNDDISSMVKFLENLMQNPSMSSINELYDFLLHENLPITDDGHFLAYKSLSIYEGDTFVDMYSNMVSDGDYVDAYTKKIRNNIGDKPKMPRHRVDDDRRQACSYGYHAGSLDYVLNSYRKDVVVIVKINPADVVSVPLDYSCKKLRTTSYEVIATYKSPLNRPVYYDDDELEYDDVYEEEDEDEFYEISVDELDEGDQIKFMYTNNQGEREERHLLIERINMPFVDGHILRRDPSSTDEIESNYRRFNSQKMENITYV